MARYLVTGGAGFIGSHVAEELVNRGEDVRIVDNLLTGKKENLDSFLDRIEFIEGDIREAEVCNNVVKGVDFILHQAALTSVQRSIENPLLTSEINITGTLNLLCAARDESVRTFVLASSSSVYGDDPRLPKTEDMKVSPLSPYAVTKNVGEMYCQIFTDIYGLPTICLRYFNVFGPRQDPFSPYAAVIPNFIVKMLVGEQPVIYGDGEQSRDFSYVSNVVEANIIAAGAKDTAPAVLNIACGERTSVNILVDEINKTLGTEIVPVHEEPRLGDVKHSFAEVSKAVKLLRYSPAVSFRQGLEKTIRWFQERKEDG
jgi:nucleoside-diphosphate-sugar epimerase